MIRVTLPPHLRRLADTGPEVSLEVAAPITQHAIIDAIESRYPALRGTIRDPATQKRRPLIRFFACEEDWSNAAPAAPLPDAIANGEKPFMIVGAIAGG